MLKTKKVNIALLGIGTVGFSTYENIIKNHDIIQSKTDLDVNVKMILEKDPKQHQNRVHKDCVVTNDYDAILNDESIDVIVELMGGVGFAKECVIKALENNKCVVTANKALLAEYMLELVGVSKNSKGSIFYEASVGGGIPVIEAIKESLSGNQIIKIQGILNGTCNYILTEMEEKDSSFDDVLCDAQKKGYAEADPTFDIDGIDTAHKLIILCALGFNQIVPFKDLKKCSGIRMIHAHDIKFCKEMGYKVKLIALVENTQNGLDLRVEPCLVHEKHPLSSVGGTYNAVFVEGDLVGQTMFYGRGAGGNPTSSAVIGDIIAAAKHTQYKDLIKRPVFSEAVSENVNLAHYGNDSKYYMRMMVEDQPGVLAKISQVLGQNQISIAQVLQKTDSINGFVPVFITTHSAHEENIQLAKKEMEEKLNELKLKETPLIMKMIS